MPQDDYLATQATEYSDVDRRTLTYLYQPILGPVATALYTSLWAESKRHPVFSQDRHPHTRLMGMLGVGIDELYDARVRLEALQLVQTFTQVDTARHYVYELHAPVAPSKFFADDLLGILLFDTVGETRYDELVHEFELTPVRRPDMHNISLAFSDVFDIVTAQATTPPATVSTSKSAVVSAGTASPEISGVQLDWELLRNLLSNTNIQSGTLSQNQHALQQLAGFYGLDEPTLAAQIGQALDLLTGKLDMRLLRRNVEQQFERVHGSHFWARGSEATAATSAAATALQPSQPTDEREQEMLARAKSMTPREFINAAKQAQDSRMFASRSEIKALQHLAERGIFSPATINVMVDYALRTSDNGNVSANFLDILANSWAAAGVHTPEQALTQIHQYAAGNTKQQQRVQQRSGNRRGKRSEPVPEWAQQDYVAPKEKISADAQAKLNAQLQELARKRQQKKE
ncbi:replicative DNA helicase DnaB [Lacticaseibacillus thailandensis DSM 22698 = JCM 13996]|uniref:Replicative DNA helicase DnaB n=2 Tax=Lacticaseibacillus thailandensis TaxID=381741 RepID=A0A0R2CAB8_9LACO|nr:replicative DNA helicase DnaB [Lacticaseibacillus thailandensis DSM 22698 = JCM 13996]